MFSSKITRCLAVVATVASLLIAASSSLAAGGLKLCVPKKEGAATLTPKHGKSKKGYRLTSITQGKEGKSGPEGKAGHEGKAGLTGAEQETLKKLIPHISFVAAGVGGKPTVQFSGVNVQVVNGEGKTASANGEGNLVIGYDEQPGTQTGSHNLALGTGQTFTSYGGFVAVFKNAVKGPFA